MPEEIKAAQGQEYSFSNADERDAVIEAAFEYRGDISVQLSNGESVEGYLFDRKQSSNHVSSVEFLSKGSDQPRTVAADEIVSLTFSGKDPADGKSYAAWLAKKETERTAEANQVEEEMRAKGYL